MPVRDRQALGQLGLGRQAEGAAGVSTLRGRIASRRGWAMLAVSLLLVGGVFAGVGRLHSGSQPASAAGDPVIASAGDIACDPKNHNFNGGNGQSGACMQKATYNLLTSINPAAVLPLGDNQYYCNSLAAYQGSYALSWGNLLSKTYPAPGNHEYLTNGGSTPSETTGCDSSNAGAAGYFNYFANAAKRGNTGQGWYSYDVGSWHLIALNSNCGDAGGCGNSSAQGSFVASDLAAHQNQCILAYWHIPLWSSGGRAASNMQPIVTQLYNAHADVILAGHDHIYERFAPQNTSGQSDPVNGIREFIVGSGGANHTSIASVAANSVIRDTSSYGVIKLTLHSGSYDWQFVPIAGASFTDSGSATCHSSGGGGSGPPAPTLTLSSTDANDYIPTGTTNVYYRQGQTGSFTVTGTSTGATSMVFPSVFGADGATDSSPPFSKIYSWGSTASATGSFGVTASSSGGTSLPTQFTVTPDNVAPTTAATCNGGSCAGSFPTSATVALTATDTGAGPKTIYYTTDGTTPTTTSPIYTTPFAVTSTKTVKFFAVDNLGNTEAVKSQLVTIGSGGGGGGVALVQQKSASASAMTLPVTLTNASGNGNTLVAAIALAAGTSASVNTVNDSAGPAGTWVKGPVGYLSGANSRVEIWYRLNAPSVSSVTVTLTSSKALSVQVSEWSGITALDRSAGSTTGSSSTSVSTPLLATTNANDVVIGAMNYPATANSNLTSASFTSLPDPPAVSGVHGRAAYIVTSSTGSYQASWSLSAASGGHGTAIIAFKVNPAALDTTPPTTPVLSLSTTDANAYVSGSTIFYRPAVAGSSGFTVGATTTDAESPVSVQFPTVFVSGDGGAAQPGPTFSKTYNWASGASASGAKTVTATSTGGSSSASFTVTPDSTAPVSQIQCGGVACAGPYTSSVSVTLSAADTGGSGVKSGFYTTDGTDPTTSGTHIAYGTPYTVTTGTTTIKYAAADNVGNVEAVKTQTIVVTPAAPPAPSLVLATTDGVDYVSGTTVFLNPNAPPGAFTVKGTSSGADAIVFPNVFSGSDGGNEAPGTEHPYAWAAAPSFTVPTSFDVKASNSGVLSAPTSFTVKPDSVPPVTTIACDGTTCGASYSSSVTVTFSADDGAGSGVQGGYYTTNLSDPTDPGNPDRVAYGSYSPPVGATTIKYAAIDRVGNVEGVKTQTIVVTPGKPSAPSLTLTPLDSDDYVNGTTVFFNPNAASGAGSFQVSASSDLADTLHFPHVFAPGTDGGAETGPTATHTYSWSTGATALTHVPPFDVTASNIGGTSDPSSFTVTADPDAPTTQISCTPSPCSSASTSSVTVALSTSDGSGSGVVDIYYTTDGSDPTTSSPTYGGSFTVPSGTTVKFFAVDHVGNAESIQSQQINTNAPGAPSLTLTALDANDYVSGSAVFFNPNTVSGAFKVDASSPGADSIDFPDVFVIGDGGTTSGATATQTYNWTTGAAPLTVSFGVTAANAGGPSAPSSFTVTADTTAPATSMSCAPGSCAAGTGPQTVTLSAAEGGSGLKKIYYTTNGSTPTTSNPYNGPFTVSATGTTTVKFFAVDNVGNTEAVQTQTVTITPSGPSLVRQTTSFGSAATMPVTLSSASSSGNTLVAVVTLAAGTSASVTSVSDSGVTWTQGPIGYLSGANSRVEIWYRLNAPSVSTVTVTLSASKALSVNVSEWSGLASVDKSAATTNGNSSTTITTPSVATTNAVDVVIGAANYPASANSTLTSGSFTGLQDFNSSSQTHGRAAYVVTSSTGTFQASWSLNVASGGHGTAIIAFKSS